MFTGIITHIGIVQTITKTGLTVKTNKTPKKFIVGDSLAVNGICLTIQKIQNANIFSMDIMPETLTKTMLGKLKKNNIVNLEFPATAKSFLSGHIVQGHVDGIGIIKKIEKRKNSKIFTIHVSAHIKKYLIDKGSIAVNGISLTIINVGKTIFTVGIIPHTFLHTNLKEAHVGDEVNVEVDILSKYIYAYAKKDS